MLGKFAPDYSPYQVAFLRESIQEEISLFEEAVYALNTQASHKTTVNLEAKSLREPFINDKGGMSIPINLNALDGNKLKQIVSKSFLKTMCFENSLDIFKKACESVLKVSSEGSLKDIFLITLDLIAEYDKNRDNFLLGVIVSVDGELYNITNPITVYCMLRDGRLMSKEEFGFTLYIYELPRNYVKEKFEKECLEGMTDVFTDTKDCKKIYDEILNYTLDIAIHSQFDYLENSSKSMGQEENFLKDTYVLAYTATGNGSRYSIKSMRPKKLADEAAVSNGLKTKGLAYFVPTTFLTKGITIPTYAYSLIHTKTDKLSSIALTPLRNCNTAMKALPSKRVVISTKDDDTLFKRKTILKELKEHIKDKEYLQRVARAVFKTLNRKLPQDCYVNIIPTDIEELDVSLNDSVCLGGLNTDKVKSIEELNHANLASPYNKNVFCHEYDYWVKINIDYTKELMKGYVEDENN